VVGGVVARGHVLWEVGFVRLKARPVPVAFEIMLQS
jgi:hypothetical protein